MQINQIWTPLVAAQWHATTSGLAVLAAVLWINFHGVISAAVMDVFHREIRWLHHVTDRFDLADRQMMV